MTGIGQAVGQGRLAATFARIRAAGEPGLVTYVTAGDPDIPRTEGILRSLDRAGADVLEIGVPFSDPLADGPVIQRATERALAAGATLAGVLDMIARVRARSARADRRLQLRQPDPAVRRRAVRRPGAGRRRRRGPGARPADRGGGRFSQSALAAAALIQFSCSVRRRPMRG